MKKMMWWKVRYNDEQKKEESTQTPPTKTFTQEELNSILAKEKRAFQEERQKLINDLNGFKEKTNMTSQEKQELEARIEEIQKATMTKEELAKREQEKIKTKYETDLKTITEAANTWRNKFTESTIRREILDEAIRGDAFSPSQIIELLNSKAKLVEVLDEQGKPTDKYATKISFEDVDKESKPVTLELTVAETVKRMKELPERFGNLFKSGVNNGVGGSNNGSGYKAGTVISDAETYRRNRSQILK